MSYAWKKKDKSFSISLLASTDVKERKKEKRSLCAKQRKSKIIKPMQNHFHKSGEKSFLIN